MSQQTNGDNSRLAQGVREELQRLCTGKQYGFTDIIEEVEDKESDFVSTAGVLIRILRAPGLELGGRQAHMQFFNIDGALVAEYTKTKESSCSFFLRKFEPELIRSRCFELLGRPSFVPAPNNADFFEIVPRKVFSVTSYLGLNQG